ncbi:MAG: VapC toxin family PIN domain ribonuclease [Actinophytocola sp.]|nr:VapC toxin family PIN domain ribonuclease [Actinophytocola sp.]
MKSDLVIDNSALIEFFTAVRPDRALRQRILTSTPIAPELLDAEALVEILSAPILRTGHRPLAGRAWQLRHAITAYDALYVALAERLDIPLVTCDAKLARSNGHNAKIELYPAQ